MFPFTISDRALTVFVDGKPRSFPASHGNFEKIKAAILAGDVEAVRALTDVKSHVAKVTMGRVQIFDTEILVDGRTVTGRLVDRIIEMVSVGSDAVSGYVKFLDNLLLNPSRTAVDELYLFIEACDLPITPDGCFLAYRFVANDYFDTYSHTVFAKPAGLMTEDELATYSVPVIGGKENEVTTQVIDGVTVVSMPRNMVDDQRDNTCSKGLHFCSYDYLPSYGTDGNGRRVLVVKINPADVVSIPSDYNNSKGRTWKYEVMNEIADWNLQRITPWFTDEYEVDPDTGEILDGDDVSDMTDEEFEEYVDSMGRPDDLDDDDVDFRGFPTRIDSDNKYATKLTWSDVQDIRADLDAGDTLTEVAQRYGISRRQAARIRDFECWTHDPDEDGTGF